jgi:RNA polymerase sigma-70 factor (ECF subfamily)
VTFEEVYQRYRDPVWRLARRLTGSDEAALDACQEIFLRVWRGLPGFRGEARLSTWVFQIAWNHLRAVRRQRLRRRDGLGSPVEIGERGVVVVDPGADPERRADARDRLERVRRAVETLPEHQRVVLWLRDGEGLSYEEIGAVLDVPIGTVRSRLARARGALRQYVEG